jgi:hypothetical protein
MSTELPEKEPSLPLEVRNQIVEHFIEQRVNLGARIDSKQAVGSKIAAQLDRTLISLSGGALLFSMTFVDKIAPAKLQLWLLFAAWVAFVVSMVAVMLAMRAEQRLIHGQIVRASKLYDTLDAQEDEALSTGRAINIVPARVAVSKGVGVLNLVAMIAFGLGVALLGTFVGYNVWKAPTSVPTQESKA